MKKIRFIVMLIVVFLALNINSIEGKCQYIGDGDDLMEWIEEQNQKLREKGYKVVGSLDDIDEESDISTSSDDSKECDHTYTSEVTKEPTCVEPGITTYTCSKCGKTYTEEIPATGEHSYEEVTKQPTCTESGETTYSCSVCGDTYTEEIPALGHDYEETITKEATCTEAGEKTYICKTCGDSYTEEIAALGHTEGDWEVTKQAGLFSKGEQIKKCSSCGEILVTETIESKYPLSYLFIAIIALLFAIAVIVVYLVKKKKINIFVKSDEALE